MRLATFIGIRKRDRKYVVKFERLLLFRVSLPPVDKYILFQQANLLSIFSRIGFQIDFSLNFILKRQIYQVFVFVNIRETATLKYGLVLWMEQLNSHERNLEWNVLLFFHEKKMIYFPSENCTSYI